LRPPVAEQVVNQQATSPASTFARCLIDPEGHYPRPRGGTQAESGGVWRRPAILPVLSPAAPVRYTGESCRAERRMP
jgi:hypothetical protein